MPLISFRTSAPANGSQALLKELSQTLATLLGKPERYVMTLLDRTRQVSSAICALIEQHLQISADRIYIGFEDVPARLWSGNVSTFG
jgi:phenylpyruvate tautomerase PptA (4-oxalocrotonate tautomerase family)